ncbi:putative olfactory receptor 52P1 [Scleropages formosus]|uniref:putative olfactory receptor 52P1 n=1 Tax=Scleropages formosus TaxID=113540 RepID=UPI0010FA9971|nr:putative olfactory receptor 52P1 [Scleropages formosus]
MEEPQWNFSHTEFFLIGFSSLGEHRRYLFLPFCVMFIFSTVCNTSLLYVIIRQRSLHAPMYVLIGSIACVDIVAPLLVAPRMLFSFLSDRNEISRAGCLLQMFFVHFVCSFQSTILLGMAVDRYFAIILPLRYNDVVNSENILRFALVYVLRNTIIISSMVILVGRLTFCASNVLYHCFCEHQLVVNLACGDTTKNYIAGFVNFCIPTVDFLGLAYSYVAIFVVIFRSAAGESRQKAIHTCGTHLIVIFITYFSSMTAFLAYRVKHAIPADYRVLISCMYFLVPGCCNPVIYGIRTKEIREQLIKLFHCTKIAPQYAKTPNFKDGATSHDTATHSQTPLCRNNPLQWSRTTLPWKSCLWSPSLHNYGMNGGEEIEREDVSVEPCQTSDPKSLNPEDH